MAKKEMTNNEIVEIMQKEFRSVRGEIKLTKKELNKKIGSVKSDLGSVKSELFEKIEAESSFVAGVAKRGFDEAEEKNKLAHKELKSEVRDIKSNTSQILRQQQAEVDRDDDQDLSIKDHEGRIIILEKEKEVV